ncbi:MAG TPA: methyltransferase domain-containing protein [Longimicrobiaceae bacterium]|nr:methyltransferase domain-containing protein [Longimicrobiaceae bacterium]
MAIDQGTRGLAEPAPAPASSGPLHDRGVRSAPPAAAAPLSREAKRVRDGLGLPITALPGVEREGRAYLHDHSEALNRLIVGEASEAGIWRFLRAHLPADAFAALRGRARVAFSPLWERDELKALEGRDLAGLEAEWKARIAAHPRWSAVSAVIRDRGDYAAIWRDILGGDFDLRGRGAEYTRGMEAFQASRWLGARTLLELLGARGGDPGIFLDVLGGDGYVWRLLEAEKGVADTRLVIVEDDHLFFGEGEAVPAGLPELMRRLAETDAHVAVVVVRPEEGASEDDEGRGEARYRARVLAAPAGELAVSAETAVAGAELLHLVHAGEASWLVAADAAGLPTVAERAEALVAAGRDSRDGALIVTNDISPHMFYRAGLWGLPTREDATRLSRSFHADSLDGVLFAYGTHHIPDMFAATREARAVMKPGAVVVVHDFFDEGPAGQWFHHVVDKHSKTGHDIPHIGPVQMAVVLFAAGFQDVALHETQDPFFFASGAGEEKARDLALHYLLGMYGMEESFRGRLDHFEAVVKTVLTYPEVNETPVFTEEFVYVPRRAVVARARRPEGEAPRYAAGDRVLIRAITELFRQEPDEVMRRAGAPEEVRQYWFGADGSRWGISPERQREWLEWAQTVV